MAGHRIGTRAQWLAARAELLEAEEVVAHLSDALAQRRRQLPWVRVEKEYLFDTAEGEKTLADLFDGRSQLLVCHFEPVPETATGYSDWVGIADSVDRATTDLNRHDVTVLCVSNAALGPLGAWKRRMGWHFPWVSSLRNDFNWDFGVSLAGNSESVPTRGDVDKSWRLLKQRAVNMEGSPPGLSAFVLEGNEVHHTYTCQARGLEAFNSTHQLLDRTPWGRGEAEQPAFTIRVPARQR